jgi:pimeloyl-ACP methyl ester carboxylesterase
VPARVWESLTREYDAYGSVLEQVRGKHLPPDIPVTVITAGKPWWPTLELNASWRKSHQQIVEAGRDRELIIADKSGHHIQFEQPNIVVDAISRLAERIRRP